MDLNGYPTGVPQLPNAAGTYLVASGATGLGQPVQAAQYGAPLYVQLPPGATGYVQAQPQYYLVNQQEAAPMAAAAQPVWATAGQQYGQPYSTNAVYGTAPDIIYAQQQATQQQPVQLDLSKLAAFLKSDSRAQQQQPGASVQQHHTGRPGNTGSSGGPVNRHAQVPGSESAAEAAAAEAAAATPDITYNLKRMSHQQLMAAAAAHNQAAIHTLDPMADTLRGIEEVAALRPGSQPAQSFSLGNVPPDSPYFKAWKAVRKGGRASATAGAPGFGYGAGAAKGSWGPSARGGSRPSAADGTAPAGPSGPSAPRTSHARAKLTPEQQRWVDKLSAYLERPVKVPLLGPGLPPLDMRALWLEVMTIGGRQAVTASQAWPALADKLQHDAGVGDLLQQLYSCYLEPLEQGLPNGVRPARALDVIEGHAQQRASVAARLGSYQGVRHAALHAEVALQALEQRQQQQKPPAQLLQPQQQQPASSGTGAAGAAHVDLLQTASSRTVPAGAATGGGRLPAAAVAAGAEAPGDQPIAASGTSANALQHPAVAAAAALLQQAALFPHEVVASVRRWGLKADFCPERVAACKKASNMAKAARKRLGREGRGGGSGTSSSSSSSSSEGSKEATGAVLSDTEVEQGSGEVRGQEERGKEASAAAASSSGGDEEVAQQQPGEDTEGGDPDLVRTVPDTPDAEGEQLVQQQQTNAAGPPTPRPYSGLSDTDEESAEDGANAVILQEQRSAAAAAAEADSDSIQAAGAVVAATGKRARCDDNNTAAAGEAAGCMQAALKRVRKQQQSEAQPAAGVSASGQQQQQPAEQPGPPQQGMVLQQQASRALSGISKSAAASDDEQVSEAGGGTCKPSSSQADGDAGRQPSATGPKPAAAAGDGLPPVAHRRSASTEASAAAALSSRLAGLPDEAVAWQAGRWLLLTCRALRAGPPGCDKPPFLLPKDTSKPPRPPGMADDRGKPAPLPRRPLFGDMDPVKGAKRTFKGITPKCGSCVTCSNPQMKKACVTNRARLAEGLPPILPGSKQ